MSHAYDVQKHCVEEYLRYVRSLEASMEAIEFDIARQNARLDLMGIPYGAMPSAPSPDALPDGIARLCELRERWSEEYCAYSGDLERARELCRPVHENRHVLWLHYVELQTWSLVARMKCFSERQVRKMGRAGVVELYYLMPEEFRRYSIPNAAPE